MATKAKSLEYHLGSLPDPRKSKGQRHLLLDVMLIAVLATLCGVDDWEGMEDFGIDQQEWLRTFLTLPNGIPWAKGIRKSVPEDIVAFDEPSADPWTRANHPFTW